ncbi:hypothetical protein AAC387_Pa04g1164 [Persea americana]
MVRLGLNQTSNKYPEWLDLLLQSKFFMPCLNLNHEELRRGEINVFCIDCKVCLCQYCFATPMHSGHKQLQIRRYMYRDVVKINDMQKLMNCSHVMPYTLNSAKVILLNPRPQAAKPPTKLNEIGPNCMSCERMLVEPNRYCSIACKVLYESKNNGCDTFELPQIEAMEMDVKKEIKIADLVSSTGSVHSNESNNSFNNLDEYNSPYHLNLKPKMMHKRKGVPRRSPFF